MYTVITTVDPSGLVLQLPSDATEEEVTLYNQAVDYLRQSKTGKALIEKLEDYDAVVTIEITYDDTVWYDYNNEIIYWDPYSGLILEDGTSVQSSALGLAHEMGHVAQDIDNLYNHLSKHERNEYNQIMREEKNNLETYETPIAKELGEPVREDYYAFTGVYKTNNPIHYSRTYYLPQWLYNITKYFYEPNYIVIERNKGV